MAKRTRKSKQATEKTPAEKEVPPGATRKAWDRPVDPGGGPGSGAGPRHAAGDPGTEEETYGPTDSTWTPASPPVEEADDLEKGPPYAGHAGGAVGGSPAQKRSAEGPAHEDTGLAESEPPPASPLQPAPSAIDRADMIRLTGAAAIEYAEKQGLTLSKHPDSLTGPRVGLSIAEAEAIADEDPDLIWLDVAKSDYYDGPPTSYEPER